jgi:hypothetical protein
MPHLQLDSDNVPAPFDSKQREISKYLQSKKAIDCTAATRNRKYAHVDAFERDDTAVDKDVPTSKDMASSILGAKFSMLPRIEAPW